MRKSVNYRFWLSDELYLIPCLVKVVILQLFTSKAQNSASFSEQMTTLLEQMGGLLKPTGLNIDIHVENFETQGETFDINCLIGNLFEGEFIKISIVTISVSVFRTYPITFT